MSVNNTLEERGKIYGDYKGGVKFRADIMCLIKNRYLEVHGQNMPYIEEQCIFDIVMKLSRLAVTPNHVDTWHDIAGYSLLSEEVFKNES